MEHLLNSLLRCMTSGKDPDLIREEVLQTLCQKLQGIGGKWLTPETSTEIGIQQSENGASSVKLKTENSTVFIFFENTAPHNLELQSVAKLLAIFEENLRLKRYLETSRDNVQTISQESASIAERNAQLFQQLIANENRMRGISRGIVKMQEEERARISRDLHDGIGQALLAIKMQLDILSNTPSAANIKEARNLAEQTLEEVRELSRLLRPRMLDDLGLLPTLQWYVRTYSERTGITVSLKTDGLEKRMDPDAETMFFRVVQEGLNNVLKHSKATAVKIAIRAGDENILFELADDGKGFLTEPADHMKGSGIQGIRDRVILLGGEFTLNSAPGKGTQLQVKLPVQQVGHKSRARRG